MAAPRTSIYSLFSSFISGSIVSAFPVFIQYTIATLNPGEGVNIYDGEAILNIFSHSEQSVPMTYLEQVFQNCNSERYQYYDYGAEGNQENYGTETPPLIPLENIQTPVALFTAPEDEIGSELNTEFILNNLGDNIVFHQSYEGYSRDSFIAAINMGYLNDVVDVLDSYPPVVASS